jgi:hypothetical protein
MGRYGRARRFDYDHDYDYEHDQDYDGEINTPPARIPVWCPASK